MICHTCMRQKFHFSNMLFLAWLTIVLYKKTKENLGFSPKKTKVCYNSWLFMCYSLFASRSRFFYTETIIWWRIQEVIILFVQLFPLLSINSTCGQYVMNKLYGEHNHMPKCTTPNHISTN